jgi:hypothetical protein
MGSDLVLYQLALVVLVWLFLMLHVVWPSSSGAGGHQSATPTSLPHKRSRDPKPFGGLTQKPACEACEQRVASPPLVPCIPPPRIILTRGRRRQVDTSGHFCPQTHCTYHGWVGLGNLRANGHPSGRRWRQLYCLECKGYFRRRMARCCRASILSSICWCGRWEPWRKAWAFAPWLEDGVRATRRARRVSTSASDSGRQHGPQQRWATQNCAGAHSGNSFAIPAARHWTRQRPGTPLPHRPAGETE